MVVERRVIMKGNLVDMRTENWVDVTVKEKKAVFGLFIPLAFHSLFAKINAEQIRFFFSGNFHIHCEKGEVKHIS